MVFQGVPQPPAQASPIGALSAPVKVTGIQSSHGDIPAEIADVVPVGRLPQLTEFGKYRQIRFTDNVSNILGLTGFSACSPTRWLVEIRSDDALGDGQDVRGNQGGKPGFGLELIR